MGPLVLLIALAASPESESIRLVGYDFRPGDRLVYRQTLERGVKGGGLDSLSRVTWENQVMILAETKQRFAIGIQRNRVLGQLLRYRENGWDRLARERREFEKALDQEPSRFVEGNAVDRRGSPLGYWSAVRERVGLLLPAIHEIESIPADAIGPGERWRAGLLGLQLESQAWEDVGGSGRCLRVSGNAGSVASLRYWLCPADGGIRKLEFSGSYSVFGDRTVTEQLTLELLEKLRDEKIDDWLVRAETRDGVLSGFMGLGEPPPFGPAAISEILDKGDAFSIRHALSFAFQRGWPAPRQLPALASHTDQRIRRLAKEDWTTAAAGLRRYPTEPPGTTVRPMSAEGHRGFPFVIHVPETYRGDRPLPLLIFLGGGPGRAVQAAQSVIESVRDLGWLVLFPHAHGMWWDDESIRAFPALLDQILRDFCVDTNRVYLAGMSNGATGAFEYATLWPHRFAGLSLMMGAGIMHPANQRLDLTSLQHLPLIFIHGEQDSIINVEATRVTVAALRRTKRSAPVEAHFLEGRDHDVSLGSDRGLSLPFLERQVRNPFPRRINFALPSLEWPRRYWIEVLAKSEGMAEIEAEIRDDNEIHVSTKRVDRIRLLLRDELFRGKPNIRVVLNGRVAHDAPIDDDHNALQTSLLDDPDPFLTCSRTLVFDIPR